MFLGDSRRTMGPGIIPAQDYRKDIELDTRNLLIACRVIDRKIDPTLRYTLDETLTGDVHGLSVWEVSDSSTNSRMCAMWRHAWPCVIYEFGDGYTEDPPPPDAFPEFTPGGGTGAQTPGGGGQEDAATGPGRWHRKQNGDWVWIPQPIGGGSGWYSGPGSGGQGGGISAPSNAPKIPGWGNP